jgi:transcriptional regulator GlxA family with amidase domain
LFVGIRSTSSGFARSISRRPEPVLGRAGSTGLHVEGRFSAPHAWIIENIGNDLRIETLAEKAGMTPRIFARTYVSRTGMTPANGVDALWMETARLLLESRQIGCVVEVAKRAGFGDDERMRRAFLRHLGVSPTEYRNRFSGP